VCLLEDINPIRQHFGKTVMMIMTTMMTEALSSDAILTFFLRSLDLTVVKMALDTLRIVIPVACMFLWVRVGSVPCKPLTGYTPQCWVSTQAHKKYANILHYFQRALILCRAQDCAKGDH
jgi:hypothetical protein